MENLHSQSFNCPIKNIRIHGGTKLEFWEQIYKIVNLHANLANYVQEVSKAVHWIGKKRPNHS